MDNIGGFVSNAMLEGFRFGQQMQMRNALESWQDYAAELERKVELLNQHLQDSNELSEKRRLSLQKALKIIENLELEKSSLTKSLEQKQETIQEILEKRKRDSQSKWDWLQQLFDDKSSLLEEIKLLKAKAKELSRKAAEYQALEHFMTEELKSRSWYFNFRSLDPGCRVHAASEGWAFFENTGEDFINLDDIEIDPLNQLDKL